MAERVCLVGLGYVGLTLAVALCETGHDVIGVERSASVRDTLRAGRAPFQEPGIDALITRHVGDGRLKVEDCVASGASVTTFIVAVGTPLSGAGSADLQHLTAAVESIAAALKHGDMVIIRSTVPVGTTRTLAKRMLDERGVDYDLAFCPERTIEGRALEELTLLPQIVAGISERSAQRAAALFGSMAPRTIVIDPIDAAEIAKLVSNSYRSLMFAFSNEVAELCETLGVSAPDVIDAACADYSRCNIPRPGPVGGPCLDKDVTLLAEGLAPLGYAPKVSLEGRDLHRALPPRSVAQIVQAVGKLALPDMASAKISLLGIAYKGEPETNDLRGTLAGPILEALREHWPTARYCGFDPVVDMDAATFGLEPCASLDEAFDGASLVIIQTNHRLFAAMPLERLAARMSSPGLIYDYWNSFGRSTVRLPAERYYAGYGTLNARLAEWQGGSAA